MIALRLRERGLEDCQAARKFFARYDQRGQEAHGVFAGRNEEEALVARARDDIGRSRRDIHAPHQPYAAYSTDAGTCVAKSGELAPEPPTCLTNMS